MLLQKDEKNVENSENTIAELPSETKWAIAVDIKTPVHDFHKRVPDMAFKVTHVTEQSK